MRAPQALCRRATSRTVYLPAEARYHEEKYRREYEWARRQVLSIVEDLQLPLIDLHLPISRHPDIPELYAHRGGHFSPAGNRLVAETMIEALRSSTSQ
ncbi:MAG: hypothetical protein DMF52_13790 [Acidobacteria bacterium]|nr:MAG: hypothetical protein DMF52_13790 [Acidobacteriota bacterium]